MSLTNAFFLPSGLQYTQFVSSYSPLYPTMTLLDSPNEGVDLLSLDIIQLPNGLLDLSLV